MIGRSEENIEILIEDLYTPSICDPDLDNNVEFFKQVEENE